MAIQYKGPQYLKIAKDSARRTSENKNWWQKSLMGALDDRFEEEDSLPSPAPLYCFRCLDRPWRRRWRRRWRWRWPWPWPPPWPWPWAPPRQKQTDSCRRCPWTPRKRQRPFPQPQDPP